MKEIKSSVSAGLKMNGLYIPGNVVEMDPEEAEAVGAFEETAISAEDALESSIDLEVNK